MTSEFGATECYVYIVLPGGTAVVTAGRFVLDTRPDGINVGRFVHGRSYLERPDAVPIDPIELKLGKAGYRTTALSQRRVRSTARRRTRVLGPSRH